MQTVPDGGCLQATDCPSGSSCNCGFLNINPSTFGCMSPGTCVTAQPACIPKFPDSILCDLDGGCRLGGTCSGHGYCTGVCMPSADASPDSGRDSGLDSSEGGGSLSDSASDSPGTDAGADTTPGDSGGDS
jgi:hypothetical protein